VRDVRKGVNKIRKNHYGKKRNQQEMVVKLIKQSSYRPRQALRVPGV
jgi:hypothetical protein